MKISVVIPAYNAADCIGTAIESCLRQTVPPFEIIVVDDGSTDETAKVAAQYQQIRFISLSENSGPSAARNKGWDIATGDIIAFLDSDDTWHPQKLEIITEIFSDYGHIQYLGHPYAVSPLPGEFAKPGNVTHQQYLSILIRNPYQPSCIAVRKNLDEHFDESYRYCEDHELSIRVAHKYSAHWLDTPLTQLGRPQLTAGGASGNKWKMRKGELRLYGSIYRHSLLYLPFIPFLWIFSLAKMLFRALFR
ncbi:MAG TPA: glycosyltransferase family 2 protein [Flavipsychrobacter sp.]